MICCGLMLVYLTSQSPCTSVASCKHIVSYNSAQMTYYNGDNITTLHPVNYTYPLRYSVDPRSKGTYIQAGNTTAHSERDSCTLMKSEDDDPKLRDIAPYSYAHNYSRLLELYPYISSLYIPDVHVSSSAEMKKSLRDTKWSTCVLFDTLPNQDTNVLGCTCVWVMDSVASLLLTFFAGLAQGYLLSHAYCLFFFTLELHLIVLYVCVCV